MIRSILFVLLASAVLVFIIAGCGEEKDNPANSSPNYDYHLVINHILQPDSTGDYFLAVASVHGDCIVDSVPIEYPFPGMTFSHDGTTLYHSRPPQPDYDGGIWATRWNTGDTIATFVDTWGEDLSVAVDDRYLLVSRGPEAALLSLPDLTPVARDSSGNSGGLIVPHRPLAYYFRLRNDTIYGIDFEPDPPVRTSTPLRDTTGQLLRIHSIGAGLSGDSLFVIAERSRDDMVFVILRSDDLTVVDEVSIPTQAYWPATIVAVPNSDLVVFNEVGSPFSHRSGIVYALDLATKSHSVLLDEGDMGYFLARDLVVTPDGAFVYVAAGNAVKIRLSNSEITFPIQNVNLEGTVMELYPLEFPQ